MIRQSVKKPYLILVMVIIVMMLASVSLTKMTTNLLPDFNLPYLMVITTDAGASPEKVEQEVTEPVESVLSTINGLSTYTSVSAENYSMTTLEFEEDADMDAALVKVYTALDTVKESLPDTASEPVVMEISMDMLATMYVGISDDEMDIYELTEYVENEVQPYFQRVGGVANVSTLGLTTQMIELHLNQEKIDDLNDELVAYVEDKFADAKEALDDAASEISEGKEKLEDSDEELSDQIDDTSSEMAKYTKQLNQALATQAAYEAALSSLNADKAALEAEKQAYIDAGVVSGYEGINTLFATLKTTLSDAATAAYLGVSADEVPKDVEEALSDAEKLANAITVLNATNQSEAASSLAAENLQSMYTIVEERIPEIDTELKNLATEITANETVKAQVDEAVEEALDKYEEVEVGKITAASAFGSSSAQIAAGQSALEDAEKELESSTEEYEEARDAALEAANLDSLLDLETLSNLIKAQDFQMPAGYIDENESDTDTQWLLKVGEKVESADELSEMILTHVDGIGDITVSDIADITVIDDSDDSYCRMNGKEAVLLSIYKASTAGTSNTSKNLNNAIDELLAQNETLNANILMDQGEYISMFINSILGNMLWGAFLAVVVLIIFLRSPKPTLVVAFSIPFSLLLAVLVMYFAGISLNIMSMSGLALGIGMLVDNSIVVIENIYRLRSRGLTAPAAAVWGARQVAGAITSSTLTTICVFLPMIFTTGTVRQFMVAFALTITFSLLASLLVAITVAPAMGSVLLKKGTPKQWGFFDTLQNGYAKILGFFLSHKWIPLGVAVGLLAFSVWGVARMGIVLLPTMSSDQIYVTVEMDESLDRDECYEKADSITDKIMAVESVESVGAMTNLSSVFSGSFGQSENNFREVSYYLTLAEDIDTESELAAAEEAIDSALSDLTDCEYEIAESGSGDMSSYMSSGLTLNIYGKDTDTLTEISEEVMDAVGEVEGFENISNGQEDSDEVIHLVIDRQKAAQYNLTIAQVYAELTDRLNTEADTVAIEEDGRDIDVTIVDERDMLTLDNLMDTQIEVTVKDDDGNDETKDIALSDIASIEKETSNASISSENGTHMMSVTADTIDGYNTTRLSEKLESKLDAIELPVGYSIENSGEVEEVSDMLAQVMKLLILGFALVYLIMVAQFQSFLGPFIILFTVPLAFTGGLLGLMISGDLISIVSLLGFLVLMGTVVNNGIVFVDYVNRLRIIDGMERREALITTGKTRMRPILMTALTTILAMAAMMISSDFSSSLTRGMAVVVSGGLAYATLMTLFVVPVMYDILYKRKPHNVDTGDDLNAPPEIS